MGLFFEVIQRVIIDLFLLENSWLSAAPVLTQLCLFYTINR